MLFLAACSSDDTQDNDTESSTQETIVDEFVENEETADTETAEVVEETNEEAELINDPCETAVYAYVYDPGEEITNIRNAPGGEVVLELQVGGLDNEYMLDLDRYQDGWFHIKGDVVGMEDDYEIPGGEGWIHSSVITADTRNYGNQPIHFYAEPSEDAEINGTLKMEAGGLQIHEACGDWVRCSFDNDATGDQYAGWIKTEWLCGNPLTNCS